MIIDNDNPRSGTSSPCASRLSRAPVVTYGPREHAEARIVMSIEVHRKRIAELELRRLFAGEDDARGVDAALRVARVALEGAPKSERNLALVAAVDWPND